MTFQILALDPAPFAHLAALDDAGLRAARARRVTATAAPGFPCRVSLADAAPGETVILTQFEHHAADTPYRAAHAIYVRPGAAMARPAPGEVPGFFAGRTLSLRGFDAAGMLRAARVTEGEALADALAAMLAESAVAQVHIHFAAPGCYAARAVRA